MEIVTKEYLENNIKAYDSYRGLGNKGKANGIATLDANGKLSNNQIPVLPETKLAVAGTNNATTNAAVNSGTVYINTYDVKGGSSNNTGAISIEGADGISVTADNGGKIKIAGHKKPALTNGTGIAIGTDNSINLQPATNNTIGGIKAGDIVGSSGKLDNITIGNSTSQTIYAPQANGKYYPIEIVGGTGSASGHAVVKIPDVPSAVYDDTADANKFSIQLEDYNIISYMNEVPTVFTGELSYNSDIIRGFLSEVNLRIEQDNQRIDTEEKFYSAINAGTIQIVAKKGLSITCPSNVLFAQLDCEMDAYGISILTPIKSTRNDQGKQQISIKESCPNAGFITKATCYAYLRFTTKHTIISGVVTKKGHTYTATIQIAYDMIKKVYTPEIYF